MFECQNHGDWVISSVAIDMKASDMPWDVGVMVQDKTLRYLTSSPISSLHGPIEESAPYCRTLRSCQVNACKQTMEINVICIDKLIVMKFYKLSW